MSVCIGTNKGGARMTFNLDVRAVPDTGSASLSRASALPLLRLEPSTEVPAVSPDDCVLDVVSSSRLRSPPRSSGEIAQSTGQGRRDGTKYNWRQEVT